MSKIQNIDSHIIADIAERIERLITNARANVAQVVNITEVITKYEIGRIIVNVVQEGEERATYGKQLLKGVSEVLTERLGDGWSVETLKRCRKFFTIYSVKQIGATVLTESSDGNLVNTVDQIQNGKKLNKIDWHIPVYAFLVSLFDANAYRIRSRTEFL